MDIDIDSAAAFVLAAPVVAFVTTLAAIALLTRGRLASVALDQPNERSLHEAPVPRTGGLGLMAGALLGWFFTQSAPAAVVLAVIALLLLSAIDDVKGLPVLARFGAHIAAAAWVCASLAAGKLGWGAVGVLTLLTAWMCNAYNFMDGSDGLAGGMAAIGFTAYGVAAGYVPFGIVNFCIVASALAFLIFNFAPAKIFLGDAGSVPLGFLAASLGLVGILSDYWPWWFPLVVFAPFLADATLTLLKRALRREPVWKAHREHAYQRLIRMGWSHRRLALTEYALMASCGGLAWIGLRCDTQTQAALVVAIVVLHIVLMLLVDRAWRAFSAAAASRASA